MLLTLHCANHASTRLHTGKVNLPRRCRLGDKSFFLSRLRKFSLTKGEDLIQNVGTMKQRYHTIIKAAENGTYVGWVEEIPGALTHGYSLGECRQKLRDSLQLMIETHRDEARLALDPSCIQESIEIDLADAHALAGAGAGEMAQSHV